MHHKVGTMNCSVQEYSVDVQSGYPWWAVRNGLLYTFPPLLQDAACEVAVVGGGITGLLVARELAHHGHDVLVLERREYGWGSTAASTALLQYEIDSPLLALARERGQKSAELIYLSCARALEELKQTCVEVGDCGYASARSLYLASHSRHVSRLQREVVARERIGLESSWLEPSDLQSEFGISAAGAILTPLAAQMDAYRFTRRLAWQLMGKGAQVYDAAEISEVQPSGRSVRLMTRQGTTVRARHVVLCLGYETQ